MFWVRCLGESNGRYTGEVRERSLVRDENGCFRLIHTHRYGVAESWFISDFLQYSSQVKSHPVCKPQMHNSLTMQNVMVGWNIRCFCLMRFLHLIGFLLNSNK